MSLGGRSSSIFRCTKFPLSARWRFDRHITDPQVDHAVGVDEDTYLLTPI